MKLLNYEILKLREILDYNSPQQTYCECEIERLYQKKNLGSKNIMELFLWTWIDQVVYWILTDDKNDTCLKESEIYERFRRKYPFPKAWYHNQPAGYIKPAYYFKLFKKFHLKNENLLLLNMTMFTWDLNVKKYFIDLGRNDIVELAEKEFIRDLTLRHRFTEDEEKEIMSLWKNIISN